MTDLAPDDDEPGTPDPNAEERFRNDDLIIHDTGAGKAPILLEEG